ncbi:MAG: ABC transporter permease [Anaerolineae bacterium]|nr:ABC transporter permease [Anaerolineae bacterium]
MLRSMWIIFRHELRRNFLRKGYLFMTFGVPLLGFALFFGYQFISEMNSRNAPADQMPAGGVAGFEELGQGIRTAGYVDQTGMFPDPGDMRDVFTPYADEVAAETALNAGEIDVYYVIPADYLETGDVTLVMPRFSLSQVSSTPVRQLILGELSQGVDQNLFNRLVNPVNFREINLQRDATGQTENNFDTDFLVVYLFAIVMMLSVFTTNGYLMQTVIEEKQTRLIEIFVSTVRPIQLLGGKILAMGSLGLLQVAVWMGAILLLGRIAAGNAVPALAALGGLSLDPDKLIVFALYFVFGYLFFAAAYGAVGAISNSMQEGPQFAVIFTLPAVIPFYFLSIFIATPDAPLPTILSIFPVTAPLSMVMRVALTTVPVWQIILGLALLAVFDGLMIALAGRMFRVQSLLAGQTPKLRDLPRLLRG